MDILDLANIYVRYQYYITILGVYNYVNHVHILLIKQ